MSLVLSIIFVVIFCNTGNMRASGNGEIVKEVLEEYMKSTGSERKRLEKEIIKIIANDIEFTDDIEGITLKTVMGDVSGDENKDAVFVLRLSPKNTVIVVYEAVDNKYKYLSVVDNFFEVKALQIMPLKKGEKSLIIVREYADQMLGAFETGTFLRIYHWQEEDFELVLNVVEDSRAYWNEMWDKENTSKEKYWLSILSLGEVVWKNGEYPVVELTSEQKYLKSIESNKVDIPGDFSTQKERVINQKYYWSEEWQHFIIKEAKEKSTGEKIAILENKADSPFDLIEEQESYRIKRKDGTILLIKKEEILEI